MGDTPPPRIGNLPREEWTDEARDVFAFWGEPNAREEGSRTNMTMTLANHPPLANAYHTFGKHLLLASTIAVRPRELVVLRTAWLVQSAYEWHYHVGYALNAGMTLEEIAACKDGPDSPVWADKPHDAAILRACDELYRDSKISDQTWAVLTRTFSPRQMMDLVFTIGNYVMLSWVVGSFGIPIEEGADIIGWDLTARSGKALGGRDRPGESKDWAAKQFDT